MKLRKQGWATLGLIFITFLAAIQYVFLNSVPSDISSFAFVCITNAIGVLLLGLIQIKKIIKSGRTVLLKGIIFAVELTGFNVFTLLGSRNMDAVIISSVISLYFMFITPILRIARRKVNFFSAIASVIAIIALLLMFGADTDAIFSSVNVVYLIIADIFFAAYVVSVSILGEGEDSFQLTFSQMLFSALFAFVGWIVESLLKREELYIPKDIHFWVSALFIGIFIRVIYGLLQISCQKHVSAIKASLIFAAEILITLITNPIMCNMFGQEYIPVTFFQIVGGILFVVATLMVDDHIMAKLGYTDIPETIQVDERDETKERSSIAKKIISLTLRFSMVTLVLSVIITMGAIHFIRNTAVSSSRSLGENASKESSTALIEQMEETVSNQVMYKTLLAEQKIDEYIDSIKLASAFANALYSNPEKYPVQEIAPARIENAGIWTMQRTLASEDVSYDSVRDECCLLGNMQTVFTQIVNNNDNIATIYVATESGFMISYDIYSDTAVTMGEGYYEYRNSDWYLQGKNSAGYSFTETYQDSYGRGLTITCFMPITDSNGEFRGCVGMDILMNEINNSMVNDGIENPRVAFLIDGEGNYIAGEGIDQNSENTGTIFDENSKDTLRMAGREMMTSANGMIHFGEGDGAEYIAYSTIDSVGWKLFIITPASVVLEPAITIRNDIDENTDTVVNAVVKGVLTVLQLCLILSALILIFVVVFAAKLSRRISDPLKNLEEDVRKISEGNLNLRTDVSTDDEIGSLAHSFNVMTDNLRKYFNDLKDVTAKEERIASELAVAKNIQANMLPTNFADFSVERGGELYAMMTPAKEVGGDFYDFFMTDDDHLALVMADVSGKGIPAALFMMISKSMIKNCVQLRKSPAEALSDVNMRLMENNKARQFVTVWLAVIDMSKGKGVAANAGHEHPVIRRAGGLYELVEYKHSAPVATMKKTKFREHEFELHPGDSLFVYTDGVAEATNKDNVLFGTDRMLDALNKKADASPQETLSNVMEGIDSFVAGAEQFDDITMLCFKYMGNTSK